MPLNLPHLQEFDLEDQRFVGFDFCAGTFRSVCQIGGDEELELRAFLHQLDTFSPSWNDAVQWEFSRLFALVGTVKLSAVDQGATVMNLDGVSGFGAPACARLEDLVLQSAGSGCYAFLRGILFRETPRPFRDGFQPRVTEKAEMPIPRWRSGGRGAVGWRSCFWRVFKMALKFNLVRGEGIEPPTNSV